MKSLMNVPFYSARQFIYWRMALGGFLTFYFLRVFPYASEIYSNQGVIPDPTVNWSYGFFPSLFYFIDSPFFVQLMHGLAVVLSIFIFFGFWRRFSGFFLWYLYASFYCRNNLTEDPSIAFVGWLILALAVIPSGEGMFPLSKKRKQEGLEISRTSLLGCMAYFSDWLFL